MTEEQIQERIRKALVGSTSEKDAKRRVNQAVPGMTMTMVIWRPGSATACVCVYDLGNKNVTGAARWDPEISDDDYVDILCED